MESALPKPLRRKLEATVVKARDIAERAARNELERLSVGDKAPGKYLTDDERKLRNRLRAHGRQLGDRRKPDGIQAIAHLVTEVAYEHWHRMLFARFLAESNLLIFEDGVTPVSIQDCFDLAEEESGDRSFGWQYAANYASKMLPQIFRVDSPVFELHFAPNDQKQLEDLLAALDEEIFLASDALGWVYQFWQSKKKEEVNASEVKIGADELPAVTQLFTEPYMVAFLLDNSLGAWWAARRLSDDDLRNAGSEEELRSKAAIPGLPLEYLRFVQEEDEVGTKRWTPAAGTFDAWPDHLSELKTLDPCCGSGHFLVAAFLMLVPMRIELEALSENEAVNKVLEENVHGLELDQRCIELAAFNLALAAWKYPLAGGFRLIPELNLACSGLSITSSKEKWLALAGEDRNLQLVLESLYTVFKDAPILGSLIDPEAYLGAETLFPASRDILDSGIDNLLDNRSDASEVELRVVASGLSKAAALMRSKYHWVVTNVPYLGIGRQSDSLRNFCERNYPDAKADLANAFLERCLGFLMPDQQGLTQLIMPENWLFLYSYTAQRKKLLNSVRWNLLVNLGGGAEAFECGPGNAVNICAISLLSSGSSDAPEKNWILSGVDLTEFKNVPDKDKGIRQKAVSTVLQSDQLGNPDCRVHLGERNSLPLLGESTDSFLGLGTGDFSKYGRNIWEFPDPQPFGWARLQSAPNKQCHYGGRSFLVAWNDHYKRVRGMDSMHRERIHNQDQSGQQAWGSLGISVALSGNLKVTLYSGDLLDKSLAALIVARQELRAPIFLYCSSVEFQKAVRKIDKKIIVANGALVKVPFDESFWMEAASNAYPQGLPLPYSNNPAEWVFHGHPCGSVIWDEDTKWTARSSLRVDDTVIQAALVRLLGYRWPAELDSDMELADEQRDWAERCKPLLPFSDDDGIVCIPAVRGEQPAEQRLEALLQAAYGEEWSLSTRDKLLEAAGCKNKSLDFWLREKFFEQHCKLFQHRPFIWHIWDGLKDGFSALANYHQLDRKNLERLIYTYLDDWIRTQKHGKAEGMDGASSRLAAAEGLKQRLEQILKGEAPYDIFVRWKPLEEQPIGWNPDLNDGVRLNIRPFMTVEDVGKKGAGVLRAKPNIHWKKDRGKDVSSAPWYHLGPDYGENEGARINDHHLTLAEKQAAQAP